MTVERMKALAAQKAKVVWKALSEDAVVELTGEIITTVEAKAIDSRGTLGDAGTEYILSPQDLEEAK